MREVAIIGIGQTKIDEHWDQSLRELAGEAVLAALMDAQRETAEALYIGNMMSSTANHQQHLGAYIADWVGLKAGEAYRVESACSSGAAAFRTGLMAVASGEIDSAVVVGVEKMTDSPGSEITAALATAADADWEVDQGVSFVALNALIMKRYMQEHGWKHQDFAQFSINAHANARNNPFARFHDPLTMESYEKGTTIADPINVFDASPMGDGAAAIMLVPAESINASSRPIIVVAGSGSATDTIAAHDRRDPTWLRAGEASVKQAYSQAGIGPAEIDLFEYHDAFTIMAALSLEACGFFERGQGPRAALDNEIALCGRIPVATLGGLKARGHPVGATGMYQIVEVVQQLRGEAGTNQISDTKYGMAQNIGGSGSNIVTHILRRA
jgi:acetyl-CoA C-acetyltransferase